ncbi:ead1fab4-810d-452d-bbdf-9ac178946ab9 [Sclerotinia trifoliorum]|uniref:Ead1fab4-810d-452d-bbdf-9ac178946ab9 n=1 Tax=Sclerotinia trifoliorum TaxID=28548 RepID=A0A8H2ZQF2_9HELO|nr:ead1fab4-810d-452d-bbdf-9ac178946ab9 [Sclerotinia trifoliorum]
MLRKFHILRLALRPSRREILDPIANMSLMHILGICEDDLVINGLGDKRYDYSPMVCKCIVIQKDGNTSWVQNRVPSVDEPLSVSKFLSSENIPLEAYEELGKEAQLCDAKLYDVQGNVVSLRNVTEELSSK